MKKSSPAWSLRGRKSDTYQNNVPGPGSYNPNLSNLEKSPTYRIGKSNRLLRNFSNNPGPGSYDPKLQSKLSPRAIIGTSKRDKLSVQEITPGPGQYEKSITISGPSYSMMGTRFENRSNSVPGPGEYNPKDEVGKAMVPSYAIGKAKRMHSKDSGVPGPGSYNFPLKNSGPKWKVGTQQRVSVSLEEIPGPGTYECLSDTSRPAFSITSRRPATSGSQVPGPGTYSPKHFFTTINYSVGTAKRNSYILSNVPGPASYNTDSPKTTGVIIGTGKRDFVLGNHQNPGPGTYETNKVWEGPKFSLRSKPMLKDLNENPGPGNYNPQHAYKAEPAWKVGKQRRDISHDNRIPGPGSYDKKSSLSGPKWMFSKSQRGKETQRDSPGPGSYDIKSTIPDVPAYLANSSF